MSSIIGLIHFFVISGICLLALVVACIIAISLMPKTNPLYELLVSLTKKLTVTLGMAAVLPPIELIPGIDLLYDFGAPVYLLFVWGSFLKQAISADSPLRRKAPLPIDISPATQAPHAQQHDHDSYY